METPTRVLALLAGLASGPVAADETIEVLSGVLVEDAVATPAPAGGTTIVRFRIDNASSQDLAMTGIHSKRAQSGALVMRQPLVGPTDVTTLSILENEVLDLRSSHIWAELRGLDNALNDGDLLEFGAVFRTFTVLVIADVHN